jgi:hypothetical protein
MKCAPLPFRPLHHRDNVRCFHADAANAVELQNYFFLAVDESAGFKFAGLGHGAEHQIYGRPYAALTSKAPLGNKL